MNKVIVIGGGFAGSLIAKRLERDFEVILIDITDYFEYTPGVLRTIVEQKHIKNVQVLHTYYLRKTRVVVGKVSEVAKKYVKIGNKRIKFDYLVICSGSRYASPIKEQHLIIDLRARNLRDYYERLRKAKRVLIIGGGLVGVELAGEISWKYKGKKKIIIVHSNDRLIERNPLKASNYAENYLKKRGVKIFYGEKVIRVENGVYITNKRKRIKTDIAFLCTGITPNFELMKKNFSDKLDGKGHVNTDRHLLLHGEKYIFAAGDITNCLEEKTAQNAERQEEVVVKNIYALERNKKLSVYACKKTPLVISLGKYNGIYSHGKFVIWGKIPALMKFLIEKREMWKKRMF